MTGFSQLEKPELKRVGLEVAAGIWMNRFWVYACRGSELCNSPVVACRRFRRIGKRWRKINDREYILGVEPIYLVVVWHDDRNFNLNINKGDT